jgi:hypothetical protein
MLWYQGPGDYGFTSYEAEQFDGRGECLDYIWDRIIARQKGLTSTKCDIFATPLLYSGDLTQ